MEKIYIKSTDVSRIVVIYKECEIKYHIEKPEKKNFWGRIIQKYQPEGYHFYNCFSNDYTAFKEPQSYVVEYNKTHDSKIEYVDGKFYNKPYVKIIYKSNEADYCYCDNYAEAIEVAERLATLCNLITIIEE